MKIDWRLPFVAAEDPDVITGPIQRGDVFTIPCGDLKNPQMSDAVGYGQVLLNHLDLLLIVVFDRSTTVYDEADEDPAELATRAPLFYFITSAKPIRKGWFRRIGAAPVAATLPLPTYPYTGDSAMDYRTHFAMQHGKPDTLLTSRVTREVREHLMPANTLVPVNLIIKAVQARFEDPATWAPDAYKPYMLHPAARADKIFPGYYG